MISSAELINRVTETRPEARANKLLHLSSDRLFSNWSPNDLPGRENQWRLDLTVGHPILLAQASQFTQNGLQWKEYLRVVELIDLESLRFRLTNLLYGEYGLALLHIGAHLSDDAMRLMVLLVGHALGRNVAPSTGGESRPLFAVTATGDPTIGGSYGGNGRNARFLKLHTDGSGIHGRRVDVMGMLCLRAARQGGVSRIADARTTYLQLDKETRDLLCTSLPRTDPYAPGIPVESLVSRPIFEKISSANGWDLRFSYHPSRLRDGVRLLHRGTIEPQLERALFQLDSVLERLAFEVLLSRGDILILNNSIVAHGRTAFTDDPAHPRLIERLWVEVDSQ
jgi:Taurine catabolism dioxygenase TauD, TfdA family